MPFLVGWRPSLLGWGHPYWVGAISSRLEAIAIRLEAIAIRLEAIAIRLEAIAIRLEAIAIRLEAIATQLRIASLWLHLLTSSGEVVCLAGTIAAAGPSCLRRLGQSCFGVPQLWPF